MTDPTGSTTYSYDRRGLLRSEQRDLGGATYTTSYAYDNDANRTAITYPTGAMLTYTYDFADRPFSVVWPSLGVSIVSAAVYRPFGPLSTLVYGNGATRTITYDARYRVMENLLTAYGGSTVADYTYSNDGAGNITAIHDATDASYDRTFAYDDLNRLLTANTGSSLWQASSYSYDAMGNILSRTLGASPADDGQVLSRPGRRASPLGVSGQVDQLFFNYQGTTPKLTNVRSTQLPANDGTVLSVPRRHGASTAAPNELMHSVQYDAAGNETQYFVQRLYSPRNLLASVIDNSSEDGNHHIDYGYDGRGVRVSRNEGPNPTGAAKRYYVYTPELQLLEITDDDTANVWSQRAHTFASPLPGNHLFVWFGGQPVAEWGPPRTADSVALSRHRPPVPLTATSLFLTFTDHLGTPLLQFTTSGDVVWRAEYEPYGNVWSMRKGSRLDQPLRFPGQDVAMTWEGGEENYNIFRWYRAGWGRYTQSDPIGLRSDLNSYRYGHDSPARNADRLGLCASGKCADCPGGGWVSTALEGEASIGAGIGAVGGLVFVGALICPSNLYFSVPFVTVCGTGGAGVSGGGSWANKLSFEKKLGKGFGFGGGAGAAGFHCSGIKCMEGLQGGEQGNFYQAGPVWYFKEKSDGGGGSCSGVGAGPEGGFFAGKFTCKTYTFPLIPDPTSPGPDQQMPEYVWF
jgi:RHS repeat-associated protein